MTVSSGNKAGGVITTCGMGGSVSGSFRDLCLSVWSFFLLDIKVFLIAGWWSWWEELMVLVETDHFLYHCIGFSCLMTSFIDFVCYYPASTFLQLLLVILFFL